MFARTDQQIQVVSNHILVEYTYVIGLFWVPTKSVLFNCILSSIFGHSDGGSIVTREGGVCTLLT